MSLTTAVGGIFPLVSFLHVPKQMPQPQWLVLGTGFLLHLPSLPNQTRSDGLLSRVRARYNNKSSTNVNRGGDPFLVLSVAHNFAPWRVKEWKLNIPDDWRKARYITANIYQYDANGSCLKDTACKMQMEAVHPTLDLALLSIPDTGSFVRQVAVAAAATGHDDDFNRRLGQFKFAPLLPLSSPFLPSSSASLPSNKPEEILVDAIGFRGRGALGDTRMDGEEATRKISAEERQKLIDEHRHAVGRQDVHVFSFTPEFDSAMKNVPTGKGFGRQGSPFIGMSGSAVCPRSEVFCAEGKTGEKAEGTRIRTACGVFYGGELAKTASITDGTKAQQGCSALFVPSQDIIKWFEEIL